MITLVWRTDVHLAVDSPQSRTDNWADTVMGKLRQVGRIARQEQAVAVIDGGDFFHVKSPTRTPHALVERIAQLHTEYPCPVYACIGNHDCKYGDYTFLNEQPLGVLFSSGVFKRLYDKHEAFFSDEEITVRVVGIPYHGTQYDMTRFENIKKGDEDYLVVVAHVLASKTGGSMFESEDIVGYKDLAGLDPQIWMFGHWHKDQGIEEIAPGKHVINIGSLTRGTLSQDDLERTPSVAILNFTKQGVKIRKQALDIKPVSEVFDLEKKEKAEVRETAMEMFVDSIQGTLEKARGEPLIEIVRKMPGLTPDIRELAMGYLEKA